MTKLIPPLLICSMILISNSALAKSIHSFDDLSAGMQVALTFDCVLMVEQGFIYLSEKGIGHPKDRQSVGKYCDQFFKKFIDWSKKKSEADINPSAMGCLIARNLGKTILKEKYNEQEYMSQVCTNTVVCGPTAKEGLASKTGKSIRECVRSMNGKAK